MFSKIRLKNHNRLKILQLLEDCFLQNPCDKRQIGDGSKVGWHCGV